MSIDFATDPTSGVTLTQLQNSFQNLQIQSELFAWMTWYTGSQSKIKVVVADNPSFPAAGVFQNDPSYPGYDWVVYIPKQAFDGDTYGSGTKWTLERLLAHEFTHVLQGMVSDPPSTEAQREEQATDYSDTVMKQSHPDEPAQEHYYNTEGDDTTGENTSGGSGDSPHVLDAGTPPYPTSAARPVPSPISTDRGQFHDQARPAGDPLVIDLSAGHTGITLTEFDADTTATFFDMNNTGFAQQTAWVSGDTGFLVRDLNSNSSIDNITEMFGTSGADGFAKLVLLDSNHDLKIDANDSAWGTLQVWLDDGDAITQSGELQTLASLNIISIDLAGVVSSTSVVGGNHISHTSTVTFTGGATAAIADAWLAFDNVNTYYKGEYTPDLEASLLPDLRGYGHLAQLSISMSEDSTLKDLVQTFVDDFEEDGFAAGLDSNTLDILYRWAGVDGVDPGSRGVNFDAQKLGFLETLFGENYVQDSELGNPNPNAGAVPMIQLAWDDVFERFQDQLILQAGGYALFTDNVIYNAWTGVVTGDTDLSQAAIEALADNAPSNPTDNVAYWTQIGQFLDSIKGLDNVSVTEAGWLDDTIYSTNVNLSWDDVVEILGGVVPTNEITGTSGADNITGTDAADTITTSDGNDTVHGGAANDTIYGQGDNDTLYGDAGSDELWGYTGNDTLYGGDGNDDLYGQDGADTLSGNGGGNRLYGGAGNDTYVYTAGANDYISEQGLSGTDQLLLPSGITSGDLTFSRVDGTGTPGYFDDLLITIDGGGSIQIDHQFSTDTPYYIETLVFYDTSTLNLTTLTNLPIYLTNGNDNIGGSLGNSATTVYALDGDDSVLTGTGNDTLDGGAGNDYLRGQTGNDTYVASAGFDRFYDTGGTDTIVIPAAFAPSDVILYRGAGYSMNDLIILVQGLGQIRVDSQYLATGNGFETLHFNYDNSDISLTTRSTLTVGTESGDSLTIPTVNFSGDAVMYGYGGNDTMHGGSANDTLYGGAGNDTLYGEGGNDTYVFTSGWGSDQVRESLSSGTDTIHLAGINPNDIRIYTEVTSGALHLVSISNPSYDINIQAGVTGTGMSESTAGLYVESVTFDASYSTTWSLTGGLTLTGTSSAENLYGTAYGDTLYGLGGGDSLWGNSGNDTLIGGTGNDTLRGGTGNDTYTFASGWEADTVIESTSQGTDTIYLTGINPADVRIYTSTTSGNLHIVSISSPSNDITVNAGITGTGTYESTIGQYVESITFDAGYSTTWDLTGALTLTGSSSTDNLYGTAYNDTLYGLDNNDTMYGNSGNDTLIGGTGNDTLRGNTGNDTYTFASGWGADTVIESTSEGTDTIYLAGIDPADIRLYTSTTSGYLHIVSISSPSNDITVNAGITGTGTYESTIGSYVESITFDAGYSTTWSLTGALTLTGTSSNDNLYGTAYNDTLYGLGSNDTMYGNSGNDTLIGGSGNDTLRGNTGNDTYTFASGWGADTVIESTSEGTDTIYLAGIDPADIRLYTSTTSGYLHIVSISSPSNDITVQAGVTGSGTYESTIGSYVESITFDAGYSTTWSLTGGLTITGTSSGESLYGTAYADTINGMGGTDTIYGNGGNDTLIGGSSGDTLRGGNDNDVLQGNGGTDNLYGESGADTFMFKAATALSASDNIQDFSTGAGDKIDISDVISGYDPLTHAITDWVQITTSGSNSLLKVDTDGAANGANWTQIATIIGVTGLTDEAALVANGNLIAHAA